MVRSEVAFRILGLDYDLLGAIRGLIALRRVFRLDFLICRKILVRIDLYRLDDKDLTARLERDRVLAGLKNYLIRVDIIAGGVAHGICTPLGRQGLLALYVIAVDIGLESGTSVLCRLVFIAPHFGNREISHSLERVLTVDPELALDSGGFAVRRERVLDINRVLSGRRDLNIPRGGTVRRSQQSASGRAVVVRDDLNLRVSFVLVVVNRVYLYL